jgi:hypothetical protein
MDKEVWEISDEIVKELHYPKLQIDNIDQDWDKYRKQIISFLEIEQFQEDLFVDSFKRYCGNYFGMKVHIKNSRLCVNLFWDNLKLIPIEEDLFQVEGFPIELKFSSKDGKRIDSFQFSKALCYYKEGVIFNEYISENFEISDMEKLCGEYWCESTKQLRKICVVDGDLYYWRGEHHQDRLLPLSKTKFIMDQSVSTLEFQQIDDMVKSFSIQLDEFKAVFKFKGDNHD